MKRFKRKRPAPRHSRAEALNCIPVKNAQIRESRLENGEVIVSYPMAMRPLVAAVLKRLGKTPTELPFKRLQLDALGTSVWDMLDGQQSVAEIILRFTQKHRLQRQEAEISVSSFLRELGRRGIVGLK